jgi:flagellar hook-associated protein 3 FlgL
MEDVRIDMQAMLSRYEDADLVETITNMTMQETAFKAALDITSRVSRLSILDYMR